ncbi:universal stress protein [Paenirhodobacter sp.]|uniref:universal stress protein n=1 Tax=Paenirhodobacter sp. TaxID=1965326 RepID=UPI003B5073BC
MNKIIAFVDGSLYSASVCGLAAWAAQRLEAGVDIIHVIGRREAQPGGPLGARSGLQAELAALDTQRARLVEMRGTAILEDAGQLVRDGGISAVTTEVVHGDLLATLAQREQEAALVLIGKRGEAADYAIGHLGSNLERIVRTATKPVLVAARAYRPVQKLLIAHDGGAASLRVIDHIAQSPLFAGLTALVVHVGPSMPEITRRLAEAEKQLRAAGLKASTRIVQGQADAALGRLVDEEGFDLLAMGAFNHSRIRSLLIGSTTAAVIHSCRVPVLMLR